MKKILLCIAFLGLLGIILVGCNKPTEKAPDPVAGNGAPTATAEYVGSDTCKACHAEYHTNFQKTMHAKAFKPLSDYPLTSAAGEITIYDAADTQKSGTINLGNTDTVYGVMMDHYIVAKAPQGFKESVVRAASLEKSGDKWAIHPAKDADVNKDGTKDYTAESFTCGACHAPGIEVNSSDYGVSCESCHGAGGNHVTASDKAGTMNPEAAGEACKSCHESNPSKDTNGNWTANTHYGTRNYFASKHSQNDALNDCMTCHETHKANASGLLLTKDKPQDICAKCHDTSFDLDKIMWKNPTDARGHFTRDHSFGALPYEDLGDDPKTPPIEITSQKALDIITKQLPAAASK